MEPESTTSASASTKKVRTKKSSPTSSSSKKKSPSSSSSKKQSTSSSKKKSSSVSSAKLKKRAVSPSSSSKKKSSPLSSSKRTSKERVNKKNEEKLPKKKTLRQSSSSSSSSSSVPSVINELSVVTDVIFEDENAVYSLEFVVSKSQDELIVEKSDIPSVELLSRVVYIGEHVLSPPLTLTTCWELIETMPRPFSMGFETFTVKPSNLKPPNAKQNKRITIVEPNSRRKHKKKRRQHYRKPIRFSKSWEDMMRVKDYEKNLTSKIWVLDEDLGWTVGTVLECYRTSLRVRLSSNNTEKVVPMDLISHYYPSHTDLAIDDSDVSKLACLNEALVVFRLNDRFVNRKLNYTWLSKNILISINPNEERKNSNHGELRKVMDDAYNNLKKTSKPQSIIISGVSGSGKSRNCTALIQQLVKSVPLEIEVDKLRAKFVACEILLQAFGNASTVRCADSTCFSKLIKIIFNPENNKVKDILFEKHGLELDRLVGPNRYERNFHVLYQVCNGWEALKLSKTLGLDQTTEYNLFGPDNLLYRKSTRPHDTKATKFALTNKEALKRTVEAMTMIGMDEYVREDILRLLAALIFLGDVEFVKAEEESIKVGSAVSEGSQESLRVACSLLEIEEAQLLASILFKKRQSKTNSTPIPLGPKRAGVMRDYLIQHIYNLVFDLVVEAMNDLFSSKSDEDTDGTRAVDTKGGLFISILELGGFAFPFRCNDDSKTTGNKAAIISTSMQFAGESLPSKFAKSHLLSLEGLFKNFNNEVVEQMFLQVLIKNEIDRVSVENTKETRKHLRSIVGQGKILQLFVGQPTGILPFLDQQSLLRGVRMERDVEFVQELTKLHEGNKLYHKAMFGYNSFKVKHYGGELLEYQGRGIVHKNSSFISKNLQFVQLFDVSISPVLALLKPMAQEQYHQESFEKECLNTISEVKTLSQKKRGAVAALSGVLEGTTTSCFVRCLLPNIEGKSATFSGPIVTQQLKYTGLQQLCKLRRSLLPFNLSGRQILMYLPVARALNQHVIDDAEAVLQVILGEDDESLWKRDNKQEDRFYLSNIAMHVLDRCRWRLREKATVRIQHYMMIRQEKVAAARKMQGFAYQYILDPNYFNRAATTIAYGFLMFRIRRNFIILRSAAVRIQSVIRLFLCRSYDRNITDKAIIPIQRRWRGYVVRQRLKLVKLCQSHGSDVLSASQAVIRTSFVVQLKNDTSSTLFGRPSRAKRQMILTSGPDPEVLLIDPTSRKVIWKFKWDRETTVAKKAEEDSTPFFQLQTSINGSIHAASFCDLLDANDNSAWPRDINRPRSILDLMDMKQASLLSQFFASFLLCGNLHRRSQKNIKVFKERFFLLHRNQLYCFKGEVISHMTVIDEKCKVRAIQDNCLEITYLGENPQVGGESLGASGLFECTLVLKAKDRAKRDKWLQGLIWQIYCLAKSKKIQEGEEMKVRRTSLVLRAKAIRSVRDSGNFQSVLLNTSATNLVSSKRRPEFIERRQSRTLGQPSLINPAGGILGSGDTISSEARSERTNRSMIAPPRKGSLYGLYHHMLSSSYGQVPGRQRNCALAEDLQKRKRHRTAASVKLQLGKVDDAVDYFLENAPFSEGMLRSTLLHRETSSDLLVFSEMETKKSNRRRSRETRKQLNNTARGDGLNDKVADLLVVLQLTQYIENFAEQGCETIRQAKGLSHEDLVDFGVSSFSHQERLIQAFQKFGVTGSLLSPVKRNSMRLDQLLVKDADDEVQLSESRPRSLKFKDESSWNCNVCQHENDGGSSKCDSCGWLLKESRLEEVCIVNEVNYWKCVHCSTVNPVHLAFCTLCNAKQVEQGDDGLEDGGNELDYEMGCRVRLVDNFGKYGVPKNTHGTVIEVYYDKPIVRVTFDEGTSVKVDTGDIVKKDSRFLALPKLNNILNKLQLPNTLLPSPPSRFLKMGSSSSTGSGGSSPSSAFQYD